MRKAAAKSFASLASRGTGYLSDVKRSEEEEEVKESRDKETSEVVFK